MNFIPGNIFAQSTVSVKFSVDVSLLVSSNKFNMATDRLLVKGAFNGWGDQNQLIREGTTSVYSVSLNLNANSWFDYKFYNASLLADNGGWESKPGFGTNGNRTLNTGTNPIVLPVVFFDNADLILNRSTDHFNFYCTAQDIGTLTDFSNKLETEYSRIVTALQTTIPQKIDVFIFKNLDAYHNAIGYPEFPTWAVGSAFGKTIIQMASPNHAGTTSYTSMLQLIIHEFVHITEAWKTTGSLPIWLNEGVATYYAGQTTTIDYIRSLINGFGGLPQLTLFENFNTFGNIGGYQMAYTIAEFVTKIHGSDKLAEFVRTVSYPVLGYADKAAFQAGWHTFLTNYYINTPPPAIAIGTIRRYGENWFMAYSPHPQKDAENNTLTYYFTITGDGFNKTFADTNHSGSFTIPRSDFKANTTYTVAAKSYDGIAYTYTATTKTFSTANIAPTVFAFTSPSNGQIAGYNQTHQIRIAWSPMQGIDDDGDPVTDKITIEGNGLNKTWEIPGATGFVLVDSSDLQPDKTYTLRGERTDGTDAVHATPITFTTGNFTGIENLVSSMQVTCYPVPVKNRLTLKADFTSPVNLKIDVYSSNGQNMMSLQEEITGNFIRDLDFSSYYSGTYFINLTAQTATGTLVRKTIKISR